jgi:hypothetical protein
MELLLTALALATLVVAVILIGTRGRPMIFFKAFGEFISVLSVNKGPLTIVGIMVALTAAFLFYFYFPPATDIGAAQPIPFSHRLHAGHKAIDCRFCHPYVERSIHPGLPPVEKCLYCHNHIIANHPEIKKEHRYFETNTPTPWVKVNYLAEHVLFNHQRHLKKGIECVNCHGKIETMDRIKNNHFYMGFCLNCHREKKVNVGCWLACHS